jgi:cell wall-associated NlpC family hydrolase
MKVFRRLCLVFIILFPLDAINQEVLSLNENKRQQILSEGEKYLGKRYRSKVGKHIFDCSGYVKFLMSGIGKNVTRSSVSQIHDGKRVKDIKDAKPGDILVFRGRNARNNRPGHVGLVHHWSNDTLYFIHSSVAKGITIDNMYDPYYAKRFLQVRNVIGE